MKPVTIAVSLKHPGFAEDLVRGLLSLDRPYFVEIAGAEGETAPESRWEVLVTDSEGKEGLTGCFEPYRVIRADENTCRISHISSQIDAAARQYRESREEPVQSTVPAGIYKGNSRVVCFQSCWGGAGTTSLALACGRMLSGAYGEHVLYLPFTVRDGSVIYRHGAEAEDPAGAGGTELFYRMKNQRPFHFGDYVCTDYAGLEYLNWGRGGMKSGNMSEEEKIRFLKLTAEQGEYDWILVDQGTGNLPFDAAVRVMVDNLQDSRAVSPEKQYGREILGSGIRIMVHNRGLENRMEAESDAAGKNGNGSFILELVDDGESFLTDEAGKVELVLSKSYAAGIKIFSEWLLETVGNPVEMW